MKTRAGMRRFRTAPALIALALVFWPPHLAPQVATSSITGFVTDTSGAFMPSVRVVATNVETGMSRTATTTAEGSYAITSIPPGTYSVTAEASGFRKYSLSSFGPLTVGQVAKLDIMLQVGAVVENVEITAEAPLIEAENATVGTVVEQKRISDLPLNGRNPFDLMRLAANVNFTAKAFMENSGFSIGTVSINGSQSGSNAFLLDSAPLNTLQENEPVISPNVDMIEQFRIQTNSQSAEYGLNGGGSVTMVTKSGTNSVHGSAYEFLRNDALDANTWTNNRLGVGKKVLRFNQFGASLGGPIYVPKVYNGRNRTFFFFNSQGTRYNTGATALTRVPTELEKSGDFSQTYIKDPSTRLPILVALYDPATTRPNPSGSGFIRDPFTGNRLPASRLDTVARNALAYYPAPKRPPDDITGTNNFVATPPAPSNTNQWMARIDHQFTSSNRLFLRHIHTKADSTGSTAQFSSDNLGDPQYSKSGSANQQFVLGDTHTFTPTLLNDLRFSVLREELLSRTASYQLGLPQKLGLPASYPSFLFPQFNIADVSGVGNRPDKIADRLQTLGSLSDTVTKIWGRHNLRAGFEGRVSLDNNFQPGAISGSFSFNRDLTGDPQSPSATGYGFATFLLGSVSSGSLTTVIAKADSYRYYAGFVQDDFKVNPRLTLNVGLRYEYIAPPTERFNRYSNFNPTAANALTGSPGVVQFAGVDFGRSVFQPDRNNFAPRVGFAYDVRGDNKLVLRGGYGIYYYVAGGTMILGPYMGFSNTSTYSALGPFPAFQLAQGVPFISQPKGPSGGASTFLGSSVTMREVGSSTPYVQQWNASVQYALPKQTVVEVAYAGNHGVKQPSGGYNLNELNPQYLSLGLKLDEQVPNPFESLGIYGKTISRRQSLLAYPAYQSVSLAVPFLGNSNYHSMLVRLEKRYSNGLSNLVSYTNSKMIGDVGVRYSGWLSGGQDTSCGQAALYNRRNCRSIEPIDISQRLVASFVYELPFGSGKPLLTSGVGAAVLGGWQMNGIFEARTGNPMIIRGANNLAADRPNQLRTANLPGGQRSEYRWFDTSAFAAPDLFTFGNAPRTEPDLRNPGYKSLDFSLFRNVTLHERLKLQMRAEAFNAFNWVNLGLPNANFLSSAFGTITGAGDARVFQLGMKVLW